MNLNVHGGSTVFHPSRHSNFITIVGKLGPLGRGIEITVTIVCPEYKDRIK